MVVAWVRCLVVYVFVGLFVCLFVCFSNDISNIDAARITKLDADIAHHESWKPIYFVVEKVKSDEAQKHCRPGSLHSANLVGLWYPA